MTPGRGSRRVGRAQGRCSADRCSSPDQQLSLAPADNPGVTDLPSAALVQADRIERAILLIRGQKVMLDADLGSLYGVETKTLVRAVKRNAQRFPTDFMFQLTHEEFANLRCHFGTSSRWGGRRYPPYAFTEHGVAMLSSVLRSPRAVQVNIEIVRTFVRLRRLLSSHEELARKLRGLERKYDSQFKVVFDAIREIMKPPSGKTHRIGFRTDE